MKHKLKVTIVAEIEVDEEWYPPEKRGDIVAAYRADLDENPDMLDFIIEKELVVTVEAVNGS